MSLSRSRTRDLRAAGWTVVQDGPLLRLRAALRALVRPCPVVHLPPRRGTR